ncbi:hypothetical protein D3C75_950170 [compost metagenome]
MVYPIGKYALGKRIIVLPDGGHAGHISLVKQIDLNIKRRGSDHRRGQVTVLAIQLAQGIALRQQPLEQFTVYSCLCLQFAQ